MGANNLPSWSIFQKRIASAIISTTNIFSACFLLASAHAVYGQTVEKTMTNLPETGQNTSYTSTFGEDSDYNFFTQSFTNNSNGTITDQVTGLMWQAGDGGEMTIEAAIIYCNALVLGGYSDWRLPTKEESMSILNFDGNNPALNTTYFPNTNAEYWWTSSVKYDDANSIWITNSGGGTGPKLKTETISAGGIKRFHPRAVRTPNSPSNVTNFTDNGDGTITDHVTGLMWQKSPLSTTYTFDQALSAAESMSTSNYTDWRLPNIKELISINSETTNAPSVNTVYFPGVISSRYWSSTTQFAPNSSAAWFNDFQNYGITSYAAKTTTYPIICVRGTGTTGSTTLDSENNFFTIENPFSGQLIIGTHANFSDLNVTLLNALGQEIQHWNHLTTSAQGKMVLETNHTLNNELYFVKIQGEKVDCFSRILKVN